MTKLDYLQLAQQLNIGNTPLVQYNNSNVYSKHEMHNASGSVKDRAALNIIVEAVNSGYLQEGGTIVDATSGNTGIALAYIGRELGYKVVLTMPDSMSIERRQILAQLDAEVILTSSALGMKGAVSMAYDIASHEGVVLARQFDNYANCRAHQISTAIEILEQVQGRLSAFVAGVGTGGTISGVGRVLKEELGSKVRIIAVEPAESAVLSGNGPAPHGIQGIGAGFVPSILDRSVIDEVVTVSSREALLATQQLIQQGWHVGISSGANITAAVSQSYRFMGSVVTICPDSSNRYRSILGEI